LNISGKQSPIFFLKEPEVNSHFYRTYLISCQETMVDS